MKYLLPLSGSPAPDVSPEDLNAIGDVREIRVPVLPNLGAFPLSEFSDLIPAYCPARIFTLEGIVNGNQLFLERR